MKVHLIYYCNFKKQNTFIILIICFLFKKNCYNKVNNISNTYYFDRVLIYIMCKFHASKYFHCFVFSPESQPSKMQICANSWP